MKSYMDDPDEIGRTARVISGQERGICKMRTGESVSVCWCYGAGSNGGNLPCPPRPSPPAPTVPEPLGSHRITDPTPIPYRPPGRVLP